MFNLHPNMGLEPCRLRAKDIVPKFTISILGIHILQILHQHLRRLIHLPRLMALCPGISQATMQDTVLVIGSTACYIILFVYR
jgi:hypothetical protein